MDMFLYESISKTDLLFKSLYDLKQFNNVNLYVGNNFKDLNDIFENLIKRQIIIKDYFKKEEIIKTKMNSNAENVKEEKKTPLYFFNNFPIEANY